MFRVGKHMTKYFDCGEVFFFRGLEVFEIPKHVT